MYIGKAIKCLVKRNEFFLAGGGGVVIFLLKNFFLIGHISSCFYLTVFFS